MTSPSEAPSSTAAAPASQAVADERKTLAPGVVHAIYRVVKGCLLHDEANKAVQQSVARANEALEAYFTGFAAEKVSILFAARAVFINRQMLRASRETYELARELGQLLEAAGGNELTIRKGVTSAELSELGGLVAGVQRDQEALKLVGPAIAQLRHLRLRYVRAFGEGRAGTPLQRAARTFAASVLAVKSFYADIKGGDYRLPHGIKRIAQRLVTQAEQDGRLLVAIAAAPPGDAGPSGVAVSSAVLALAMAQQLSSDRTALANVVSAGLLYDAGRARLIGAPLPGIPATSVERRLNASEEERLAASAVFTLSAVGKMHPPSLARTVLVYEALALRTAVTAPYFGRRTPSVLARVLHTARLFVEARVSDGREAGLSMDDALQVVASQARDATERTLAKLLTGALGIFPAGTMVELSTGEMAVVTATPLLPAQFARPPVRILYDAKANLLDEPKDVDLANDRGEDGRPARFVVRPVDADDQQFKQMRAYVQGLARAKQRRPASGPLGMGTVRPSPREEDAQRMASTKPPPRKFAGSVPPAKLVSDSPPAKLISESPAPPHEAPSPPRRRPSTPVQAALHAASRAASLRADSRAEPDDASTAPPPKRASLASPAAKHTPVGDPMPERQRRAAMPTPPAPLKAVDPDDHQQRPRVETPVVTPPLDLDLGDGDAAPPMDDGPEIEVSMGLGGGLFDFGESSPEPSPTSTPASEPAPTSQPASSGSVPARKRRPRPFIARRDPRAEEDDGPIPSSVERPLEPRIKRKPTGSTRAVSWGEYNPLLEEAAAKDEDQGIAPVSTAGGDSSDTDALLAAYLNEGAAGGTPPPPSPGRGLSSGPPSRSTGGLRWGSDRPSPSETPPSTGGLRWGAEPAEGDTATPPSDDYAEQVGRSIKVPREGARPRNTGGLRWGGSSDEGEEEI